MLHTGRRYSSERERISAKKEGPESMVRLWAERPGLSRFSSMPSYLAAEICRNISAKGTSSGMDQALMDFFIALILLF